MCLSCRQNGQESINPPYTAEVVHINLLQTYQNPSQSPLLNLEAREFWSLTNIDLLDGPYFRIYRGGKISQSNNDLEFNEYHSPKLFYRLVNQVVIPQDYSTLTMLSAYYQFDTIAKHLSNLTGISITELVEQYGKYEIFFEPYLYDELEGIGFKTYLKENAAYLPSKHKFILLLRSEQEHVPLPLNLQVISHEFGHSLWQYVFDNKRTLVCDRLNAEYSISGLNEGFADFFSYTLTGSTDILYNSIPSHSLSTMRNFSQISFNYEKIADIADESNFICDQSFYCTGTLFANALFKAQKKLGYDQKKLSGKNSRGEFLTKIIYALKQTRENMIVLPYVPKDFNTCSAVNYTSSTYNGLILGNLFQSFVSQINDLDLRKELCQSLSENFGELGFSIEFQMDSCL